MIHVQMDGTVELIGRCEIDDICMIDGTVAINRTVHRHDPVRLVNIAVFEHLPRRLRISQVFAVVRQPKLRNLCRIKVSLTLPLRRYRNASTGTDALDSVAYLNIVVLKVHEDAFRVVDGARQIHLSVAVVPIEMCDAIDRVQRPVDVEILLDKGEGHVNLIALLPTAYGVFLIYDAINLNGFGDLILIGCKTLENFDNAQT